MGKFMEKLQGQKIVVIGGTSGIGFGAAEAFVDAGAYVTVISSSQVKVDRAVQRLKSSDVKGHTADARDEAGLVDVLLSLAPVDHIIYSGVDKIIRGKLENLELDEAKHLFDVKFWGAVIVGKAVLKHNIIRTGGSLTLTSGMAAIKPGKEAAVGGALNGGVISLMKGLAGDLAEKKIRVNCVVPGLVQTELWDSMGKTAEQQKEDFEKSAKALPVGFVATPEDIAEAYLYCVRANYATGSVVEIHGGVIL